MPRLECLTIINQLKLNAISKHFDEIVTEGIKRKRSTFKGLQLLLILDSFDGSFITLISLWFLLSAL